MTGGWTGVHVGLEEGADGGVMAYALNLPGCCAVGDSPEAAMDAFERVLMDWLRFLASAGERVPPRGTELEITVDEWVSTDASVLAGETEARFADDLRPLAQDEAERGVQRLGTLRSRVLASVRRRPDALLDAETPAGMTARQVLEELARAQWWTLSRLGATPMAEVPEKTLARLDTAMALVVDRLTTLPDDARGRCLELDGEEWTPRKVLRRLLWLEWSLGGAAMAALAPVVRAGG
ncbi:MAG TPA: type II toxin-antitoxin system HicB family antitoxin [Longimicrobium sp.]|nr:type II toxin-antitoxin system HicB family antitoxin [Longimicrobium sp.]